MSHRVAWIATVIAVALILFVSIASGGPIEDRWPAPGDELRPPAAPAAITEAATTGAAVAGAAATSRATVPRHRSGGGIACARSPRGGSTYWFWREIDGRRCWYEGTRLLPKARLRWK